MCQDREWKFEVTQGIKWGAIKISSWANTVPAPRKIPRGEVRTAVFHLSGRNEGFEQVTVGVNVGP